MFFPAISRIFFHQNPISRQTDAGTASAASDGSHRSTAPESIRIHQSESGGLSPGQNPINEKKTPPVYPPAAPIHNRR
ncbi:MAG: hypothetical protein IJG38_07725 [Thermoguttaceae bacterium]|nr:hypothetical protein [Thermoguttaceae bacterium]